MADEAKTTTVADLPAFKPTTPSKIEALKAKADAEASADAVSSNTPPGFLVQHDRVGEWAKGQVVSAEELKAKGAEVDRLVSLGALKPQ